MVVMVYVSHDYENQTCGAKLMTIFQLVMHCMTGCFHTTACTTDALPSHP